METSGKKAIIVGGAFYRAGGRLVAVLTICTGR